MMEEFHPYQAFFEAKSSHDTGSMGATPKEALDEIPTAIVEPTQAIRDNGPTIQEETDVQILHTLQKKVFGQKRALKLTKSLGQSATQNGELATFFVKETREEIHLRMMEGRKPLDMSKRSHLLQSKELVRDPVLDFPKRSSWTYNSSKYDGMRRSPVP